MGPKGRLSGPAMTAQSFGYWKGRIGNLAQSKDDPGVGDAWTGFHCSIGLAWARPWAALKPLVPAGALKLGPKRLLPIGKQSSA